MFYNILDKKKLQTDQGIWPITWKLNCLLEITGAMLHRMLYCLCIILHAVHIRLYEFLRTFQRLDTSVFILVYYCYFWRLTQACFDYIVMHINEPWFTVYVIRLIQIKYLDQHVRSTGVSSLRFPYMPASNPVPNSVPKFCKIPFNHSS